MPGSKRSSRETGRSRPTSSRTTSAPTTGASSPCAACSAGTTPSTLLGDARWCAYATSVARAVDAQADAVLADWTVSYEGGPPFREVVADPDQAQEWLSMLVNDDINLARRVRERRDEGDVPVPEPAADRAAQLTGLALVTTALAPLLGDELATRLDGELDAAIAALEAGDLAGGQALADEVDKTLTTDVAGRLDVTVGFSDADGDGSS